MKLTLIGFVAGLRLCKSNTTKSEFECKHKMDLQTFMQLILNAHTFVYMTMALDAQDNTFALMSLSNESNCILCSVLEVDLLDV